ncbi:MAG: hypothetical protein IJ329_02825 [Clostridia bacterium]|nr:hypothetical protein [Clostridia bacterium]
MNNSKNILHHLYHGNFGEADKSTKEFFNTTEYRDMAKAHEELENTFSEQQHNLFDNYYIAESGFMGLLLERAYFNGFKTGFWLAFELMEFQV